MKAVTEKPTKYTKWCVVNDKSGKILYLSTDKAMATALTVGQAFVSKINVINQGDPRITLYAYTSLGIKRAVAYCYGVVHYKDRTCGKMIDAKTHKKYLADIISGQRLNKGWTTYESMF